MTALEHELNRVLAAFVEGLLGFMGDRVVSVVLYGSVVFDDLAPGYGDLDFLAVIDTDLSDLDRENLIHLRKTFRSGNYGVLGHMLEGAFLPLRMLDPTVDGSALWWGTTRERPWSKNSLGALVLHVIRERGRVIFGKDIRGKISPPTREEMLDDVRHFCSGAREHGRGGNLHSVDWLLSAARLLLWIRESRLSSKSEAADWGFENASGEWRVLLPEAKRLRLEPAAADSPRADAWLAGLTVPIQQAAVELADELAKLTPGRGQ